MATSRTFYADEKDPYAKGLEEFGSRRYEEAARSFREAVEANPDHVEAWRGLTMTLLRKGDYDEAVLAGRLLVALVPEDTLAYTSLSMCLVKKGLTDEAEEASAKARLLAWKNELAMNPDGPASNP